MSKYTNEQQLDLFAVDDSKDRDEENSEVRAALEKLLAKTDDFRLLERVPVTKENVQLPYRLSDKVGDEVTLIVLDTETTGLSHDVDTIIELGMVAVSYSPSEKKLVSIDRIFTEYEDPGRPIAKEITEITGISDADVKDRHINDQMVKSYIDAAELIVAHNASFDRPMFEKRFSDFDTKRWACSLKGVDWNQFNISNHKQEELLFGIGYFYEAHRASIDCLALAWFLHKRPDIFENLLLNAEKNSVLVRAFGAPFDAKDSLKGRGYRWHDGVGGGNKHWGKEIPEDSLSDEKIYLDELYAFGSEKASFIKCSAENRFKKQ